MEYAINAHGFRGPEIGDKHRRRLLVVGDSIAEGHGVPFESALPSLRHGRREEVHLEEVPASRRAPVLKRYLERAPGARPHLPIDKDAPLTEFQRVAPAFPVFRVISRSSPARRRLAGSETSVPRKGGARSFLQRRFPGPRRRAEEQHLFDLLTFAKIEVQKCVPIF